MTSLRCLCGCKSDAVWLISGTDYGQVFKDEPACDMAADYCAEAASEVGDKTFTRRRVSSTAKREGE